MSHFGVSFLLLVCHISFRSVILSHMCIQCSYCGACVLMWVCNMFLLWRIPKHVGPMLVCRVLFWCAVSHIGVSSCLMLVCKMFLLWYVVCLDL